MTRRDWWLGVAVLSLAVLLHALMPRYDITTTPGGMMRVDRWTGRAEVVGGANVARAGWLTTP